MIKNYIKIALKVLLRRKFFTFISLFGIGFTLVVLMVITALFDHIFGLQEPEINQDRTLGIHRVIITGDAGTTSAMAGYELLTDYLDIKTLPNVEKTSISSMFLPIVTYHNGQRYSLFKRSTDGAYWEIHNFNFLEGGPFTEEDNKNGNFVAVINESTKNKFYGDEPAYGKYFEVEGQRFRVIGVVKDVPILRIVPFSDIWVPYSTTKNFGMLQDEGLAGLNVGLILAKDRSDFPAIKAEFRSRLDRIDMQKIDRYDEIITVPETFFESVARLAFGSGGRSFEDSSDMLLVSLIVLIVLFMLLPTINLININMSRIMERASEIGVRKAFGASSGKLVGQFITENLILTLIGGMLGFIISHFVLMIINDSGIIPYADLHINIRIFIYGFLTTIFFGVFSGVYPAWKMSRMHPVEALREGLQ